MSDTVVKNPRKSILKHTKPTSTNNNSNSTTSSWLSKFNTNDINQNRPASPTRLNSLFSFSRKPSFQSLNTQKQTTVETNNTIQEISQLLNELEPKELKRVRFPISDIKTEYLFLKDDLVVVGKDHGSDPTRLQKKLGEIVIEPINIQTLGQLLSLYEMTCRNKGESTIDSLVSILITQTHLAFLTRLDLTNQSLNRYNISPLADIMCVDFGLTEMVLTNCGLEDDAVRVLAHSLLENDKVKQLSLANNPKITTRGFKYISVYVKGSTQLLTLDLSSTQPDKKSIQYLSAATTKASSLDRAPSVVRLVLNGCNLRNTPQLEILTAGIRKSTSCLDQLSLRSNRIAQQGALCIGILLRDYDNELQVHGLTWLDLSGNDLIGQQQGIQYIAQALKRNQSLKLLALRDCKIDAKGCVLLAEALKYNQHLEKLDIGYNPLCTPNLDGINALREALNLNHSLKDLGLENTELSSEAAIAIAESIPENKSLVRLDLSKNPRIEIAGLLAFSVSVKMNNTITYIDIHIPANNKEMEEIHNVILASCTRNSQNAKEALLSSEGSLKDPLVTAATSTTTAQATARLTLEERLAAVTKGKSASTTTSKPTAPLLSSTTTTTLNETAPPLSPHTNPSPPPPAHTFDDSSILIDQAFDAAGQLEAILTGKNDTQHQDNDIDFALANCIDIQSNLCAKIPLITDPSQLELLLTVNDKLTFTIQESEQKQQSQKDVDNSAVMTIVEDDNNDYNKPSEVIDIIEPSTSVDAPAPALIAATEEEDPLSSSFEIGDDEDDSSVEGEDNSSSGGGNNNSLKELRSEIEAEESQAFLKAKKMEEEEKNLLLKDNSSSDGIDYDDASSLVINATTTMMEDGKTIRLENHSKDHDKIATVSLLLDKEEEQETKLGKSVVTLDEAISDLKVE